MEDIFKGTNEFKQEVYEKVQLELNQFGQKTQMETANQAKGTEIGAKEREGLTTQNLVKIDEEKKITTTQTEKLKTQFLSKASVEYETQAKKKGEIGAKEREGLNLANFDVETNIITTQRQGEAMEEEIRVKTDVQVFENEKEADMAEVNAELATKKATSFFLPINAAKVAVIFLFLIFIHLVAAARSFPEGRGPVPPSAPNPCTWIPNTPGNGHCN